MKGTRQMRESRRVVKVKDRKVRVETGGKRRGA